MSPGLYRASVSSGFGEYRGGVQGGVGGGVPMPAAGGLGAGGGSCAATGSSKAAAKEWRGSDKWWMAKGLDGGAGAMHKQRPVGWSCFL